MDTVFKMADDPGNGDKMIKRYGNQFQYNSQDKTQLKEDDMGVYVLFTDYMKMERAFRQLHLTVEAEFGSGMTTRAEGDAEVEKVLNGEYDKVSFTCSGEPMDLYHYYEEKK